MSLTGSQMTTKIFAILDPDSEAELQAKRFINLLHTEVLKSIIDSLPESEIEKLRSSINELPEEEVYTTLKEIVNIEEYKKLYKATVSKRCYELVQSFLPTLSSEQKTKIKELLSTAY